MNPPYLPLRIDEKFKARFLKNTLRLGERVEFIGYNVRMPAGPAMRELLWPALAPMLGDFTVRGLTALPGNGMPVIPVVYPSYLIPRGTVLCVEGVLSDFSVYSAKSGRFVLADSVKKVPVERYLELERTGLSGNAMLQIMDSAFTGAARDVMLTYFSGSGSYVGRVGGSAVSFLKASARGYAENFKELMSMVNAINPILTRTEMTVRLRYDSEVEVKLKGGFKIRYQHLTPRRAERFYQSRKARAWEQSAMTDSKISMETLISLSDAPLIPTREEVQVGDENLLKEYSLDMGFYAFQNHIRRPEIDGGEVLRYKELLVSRLEREVPDIVEAMRLGIIMDIGDVNGFGEHMARAMDAWYRISGEWRVEPVLSMYVELFSRVEDIKGERIRREVAAQSLAKRDRLLTNRVLWELNTLKPEGWEYEYFEQKMRERGLTRIAKRFEELLREGIVIEKRKGVYFAVAKL
ncbi:MAG: hypothetical protein GXO25_02070 [Euryarchaeota archaeon]|nr:hypothetical protein [Euryarchaeota archaeon]